MLFGLKRILSVKCYSNSKQQPTLIRQINVVTDEPKAKVQDLEKVTDHLKEFMK
jgi:hypothetical protein